ncbi:amidohydrolase [Pseudomaricurvus alcaniphilus]|nr:amidohydrolase [Pseudomaricurvus alcaniphilus]
MCFKRATLLFATLALAACSENHLRQSFASEKAQEEADLLLTNGKFYTVNADQPWAEAVAIKNGNYLYVGAMRNAAEFKGENTKVVDLGGKMAMPGINDAHVHPTRGGIKKLFDCNFPFDSNPDQIAAAVAECVENNPDATWIRGGQWDSGFFDRYKIASPRRFLDAVSGDKAVLLNDDSNHNGWANTKALELAGITAETPDPADGTYVREPGSRVPNGLLLEGAEQLLSDKLPDWSPREYQLGALEAVRIANGFGITGMKDASTDEPTLAAYHALDQKGLLSVHMTTSIRTPYGHRTQPLDYDRIDGLRDKYSSRHVNTAAVKIFMDGVPTASRTAAMLHPYAHAEEHSHGNPVDGMLHLQPNLLTEDLIELDKRGYTVKIHTAGDRSVRVALDAIAAARLANGDSGQRHELAHAGYIDPVDLPRFAELQAVADLSPYLWHPSPIIASIIDAVGSPRGEHYWPIKSLLQAQAPILAGSDWPAAVETIDPWLGIEAMVTRADPEGKHTGTLWEAQSISLEDAVEIYTTRGAAALGRGNITGSIEVGKSADLIVLNHNLFAIEPQAISQTEVQMTLFEGTVVYRKDDFKRGR